MPEEAKKDDLIDVGEADEKATEINLDDKGEPETRIEALSGVLIVRVASYCSQLLLVYAGAGRENGIIFS